MGSGLGFGCLSSGVLKMAMVVGEPKRNRKNGKRAKRERERERERIFFLIQFTRDMILLGQLVDVSGLGGI